MLNDLATVRMQVLVLIVTIVSLVVVASGNDCEDKVEFHLGTKGPYRFLANKNYDVNSEDKGNYNLYCTLTYVLNYMIIYSTQHKITL